MNKEYCPIAGSHCTLYPQECTAVRYIIYAFWNSICYLKREPLILPPPCFHSIVYAPLHLPAILFHLCKRHHFQLPELSSSINGKHITAEYTLTHSFAIYSGIWIAHFYTLLLRRVLHCASKIMFHVNFQYCGFQSTICCKQSKQLLTTSVFQVYNIGIL